MHGLKLLELVGAFFGMCLQDPSIPTAKLTAGPLWVAPKQPIPVQTEFRTRVVGEFSSFKILEVDTPCWIVGNDRG